MGGSGFDPGAAQLNRNNLNPMNLPKLKLIAFAGLLLSPPFVQGLPQPIGNGVLTGPLNANGKAITNVATVTFADGSSQNTAQIPGMVTNTGVNYSIGLSNAFVQNGVLSWNLPFGFYVWGDSFNPAIGDGSFSLMADNVTPLATFARDQTGHFYFAVPGPIPVFGNGIGLTNLYATAAVTATNDSSGRLIASLLAPSDLGAAGVLTNNHTSAVTLSNSLTVAGVCSASSYQISGRYGPQSLADEFRVFNVADGNPLADAAGVYAPMGQTIMDNNGRYGTGNGLAITNVHAATSVVATNDSNGQPIWTALHTNSVGSAAFHNAGDFDVAGAGSTAARASTNTLCAAALIGTAPASVITNAPGFWAAAPSSGGNTNCVQAYAGNGTNLILNVGVTNAFWILATNNIYLAAPSGLLAGQFFTLQIIQDSAGGHSFSYNPNYWKVSGGIAPALATNAGAWNALICLAGPSGTNVAFVLTPNLR
jgi:hypothetical protein